MPISTSIARTIFKSTPITTNTYIYTSAGGAGADDGWVSGKNDFNYLQVYLGTLTATSVSVRVEGRSLDSEAIDRAASIVVETYTAVHTIDKVITLSEKYNEFRVGAKMDSVATPNYIHARFIHANEL